MTPTLSNSHEVAEYKSTTSPGRFSLALEVGWGRAVGRVQCDLIFIVVFFSHDMAFQSSFAEVLTNINKRTLNSYFGKFYSQLSPCEHLAITDTPIKRTAVKSQEKPNYRRLTEINSRYYGLSLMRTLT